MPAEFDGITNGIKTCAVFLFFPPTVQVWCPTGEAQSLESCHSHYMTTFVDIFISDRGITEVNLI